ncbi:MAG: hypothetical protein KAT12_02375 [Gammaproteobacteria bacterium]|nr:hypothetical protein [Gammaproteobacteria bacterium]
MSLLYRLIFVTSLTGTLIIADSPVVTADVQQLNTSREITTGYSALMLFLEDEQHLTSIRRAKMVINFSGISDRSEKLVDDIANSSAQAIEELEKLSKAKPVIAFETFSDDTIAKATIDSLRMTTAKEFLFDGDDFEKDLLISQLKVLRVISHLARQLAEKETNSRREKWLNQLAERYENYYQKANTGIMLAASLKDKT